MRAFSDYNPIAILVYFLSVAGIAMFCMNPIIIILSLFGAVTLFIIHNRSEGIRPHLIFLVMFIVMALINPVFSHNGVTVLFVVNNNPITLEAVVYGVASSAMIISVLYWFRSFSQLMTSDRLLYLFGSLSPKLALILSMSLRYIPLFGLQAKKVNQTQKALGLYKDDNAVDRLRGGSRVFSVMVTWALENGIITADSMIARGYGIGRRSFFSLYRFRRSDLLLIALTCVMAAMTVIGIGLGTLDFAYYPAVGEIILSLLSVAAYTAYGLLAFLPTLIEIRKEVGWRYLLSKTPMSAGL